MKPFDPGIWKVLDVIRSPEDAPATFSDNIARFTLEHCIAIAYKSPSTAVCCRQLFNVVLVALDHCSPHILRFISGNDSFNVESHCSFFKEYVPIKETSHSKLVLYSCVISICL